MLNKKTGILAPKNRKFLIAGIAAAAIGTYLIAGDKIKGLFKKDETQEPETDKQPVIAPVVQTAPVQTVQPTIVQPVIVQQSDTLDPDKRIKKGDRGDLVKRLQIIINDINWTKGFKTGSDLQRTDPVTNEIIAIYKHPIKTDGDFGNNTENAAFDVFDFYQKNKYITLDQARYAWAYNRGYFGSSFPDVLRSSKRYKRYADAFKTGQIDYKKQ